MKKIILGMLVIAFSMIACHKPRVNHNHDCNSEECNCGSECGCSSECSCKKNK